MNPELKQGTLVDVLLKGVRIIQIAGSPLPNYGPGIFVDVPTVSGLGGTSTLIRVESPNVTVTVVEAAPPVGWPPQRMDLWRDRAGGLWFGVDISDPDETDETEEPKIVLVPSYDADRYPPETVRRNGSPMTLVYREES